MKTHSLIKGVSVVATALAIALGGVGVVPLETGLVRVAAQETATAAFSSGQVVQIDADVLNMRADASIDAEIVAELANGTWATVVDGPVTGGDYSWYQVEYDDNTGWVAAEFLTDAATSAPLAEGSTVIVNTAALNLRSAADSSSDVVELLEGFAEGQVVSGPETADEMVWYEVDFGGTQGWVSRSFLALPVTGDDSSTANESATPTVVATDEAI